jgi:orotate phosphoribosyltransferase
MDQQLLDMLSAREGHFRYESGYHSNLWLDLDLLFLRPRAVQPFAIALARQLAQHNITAICGPLMGGALIAQTVAVELDIEFYYTERYVRPDDNGLYPVEYRLPATLQKVISVKRIAIVDDVISAGSAVRGTYTTVQSFGASTSVIGALLVMGDTAPNYFGERNIPVEHIAQRPSNLWKPEECPLCTANMLLEDVTAR